MYRSIYLSIYFCISISIHIYRLSIVYHTESVILYLSYCIILRVSFYVHIIEENYIGPEGHLTTNTCIISIYLSIYLFVYLLVSNLLLPVLILFFFENVYAKIIYIFIYLYIYIYQSIYLYCRHVDKYEEIGFDTKICKWV